MISPWQNASAYIDTTSDSFNKPKPIISKPYLYKESTMDRYMDIAADKLGGPVLGTMITGPVGLIMKVSDKAFKHQEKNNSETNQ